MSAAKAQIIYFHGVPGTGAETALAGVVAGANLPQLIAIDRSAIAPTLTGQSYFDALAKHVAQTPGSLHLVGFSIGAAAALRTAALLRDRVSQIDLIAPAAPLELGCFLDHAAGGAMFRMAAHHPRRFAIVTAMQALLARLAPRLLVRMMFTNAAGDDRSLARDRHFITAMAAILGQVFGAGRAGYCREIIAYVQPWASCLADIVAPVRIWQGDADNWSPPMMASELAKYLPHGAEVHNLSGASHYSALQRALPQIMLTLD